MKNKEGLLSKLKVEVFKSKRYDEKIADLKKQRDKANKAIKNYISENKEMFKKKRLRNIFTSNFIENSFFSSFIVCMTFFVISVIFFTLNLPSWICTISISFTFLSFFCLSIIPFMMSFGLSSKKEKLMLKLMRLCKSRNRTIVSLKNIKAEKENISKMIEDFESCNNENNRKLLASPINADFLKTLSSHFSEDEIKKMLFIKSGEHISYYDILNFINKIENEEKYANHARHIKQIEHSEEVYCAN